MIARAPAQSAVEALNATLVLLVELDNHNWPQTESDEYHGREGQCPFDLERVKKLVHEALGYPPSP